MSRKSSLIGTTPISVISQSKVHELQGMKFTHRVISFKGQKIVILIDLYSKEAPKKLVEIKHGLANISIFCRQYPRIRENQLVLYRDEEYKWGGWCVHASGTRKFNLDLKKQPSWPTPELLNQLILKHRMLSLDG